MREEANILNRRAISRKRDKRTLNVVNDHVTKFVHHDMLPIPRERILCGYRSTTHLPVPF